MVFTPRGVVAVELCLNFFLSPLLLERFPPAQTRLQTCPSTELCVQPLGRRNKWLFGPELLVFLLYKSLSCSTDSVGGWEQAGHSEDGFCVSLSLRKVSRSVAIFCNKFSFWQMEYCSYVQLTQFWEWKIQIWCCFVELGYSHILTKYLLMKILISNTNSALSHPILCFKTPWGHCPLFCDGNTCFNGKKLILG